jgi:hypothetical protein
MNEASDTYTTRFNQSPTNPWIESQAVGIWDVNSDMERMTHYGPIKELRSVWQERLAGERVAFLVEPQQANPGGHIGFQKSLFGRLVENIKSQLLLARNTSLRDPYFTARSNATRVTTDERFSLFLNTPSDIRSATTWMIPAESMPQENEGIPAHGSESWDEEDDRRFDLLVEKEALGELDSNESDELERLSKKRDRTLARVSDEDWARERERSKALAELQDLLERYAPLFAKRR